MHFLNPRTDFAFKKIFGSEQSHDILLSFLNAILRLESPYRIEEVTLLDPYQAPKIHGIKETYVDVKARDEQGRWYIIEMQVLNVEGFEKRILYNACKTYVGQLGTGERYGLLTDVIAITITNFIMFKERAEVTSSFKLRADDGGELYSNDLQLVFAELPKFNQQESELTSVLDKWFYFLKHAEDLRVAPPALDAEPAIHHALHIANRANFSPEELEDQERREMYIQDQRGAFEKALNQGRQEGEVKGKAEGQQEERLRIARSLLPTMDDAGIAQVTGMNVDDVQKLRQS